MNPGQTLGPYEIEDRIAEGGMGVVYRAKNRVTGQLRALKVVREELARNREFVDRFVREATIASAVRHPNLVETLEPGIEGTTIYLPMELLLGETLASRLRRQKRMSAHECATLLAPVCEAVQLLHDQNLVHRDLKPGNIFIATVSGREVAKVIDLGTTRDLEDAEHTQTGMVVGSPYYMAPEQAEGRRDVDGRADQYALGVVAYQLVTGARPYESDDTRSALAKLMRGDPYEPPSRVFSGVAPSVEAAIVRALSREREHRFPRIVDFGRALAMAASGMDAAHTVADLGDAVEQAKALIAARPVLTVAAGAETQIRDVEAIAPAPTPTPTPVGSGFAAPPPVASAEPTRASGGGGRLVAIIGVVALLAVVGAVVTWYQYTQASQPTVVELGPAPPTTVAATAIPDVPPPSTVATAIAPASSVVSSTGVPSTGVPSTGVPSTGVPSTGVPSTVVPPTSVAAPPPTAALPPTTAIAPPPTTRIATPPPSTGEHRHRPPPSTATAACGAATGIPCVE
jgi:serine/threonine protein kinase